MGERRILSTIILISLAFLVLVKLTSSCNQMLCASVVSKCLLTQSCKCELKNCTCCRDCFQCLSWLWQECCSCVGKFASFSCLIDDHPSDFLVDLCPKPSDTKNPLSKQSHYEKLEGIPGLFDALLDDPDDDKWSVFTFPVDYDSSMYGAETKDLQFFTRKFGFLYENLKFDVFAFRIS